MAETGQVIGVSVTAGSLSGIVHEAFKIAQGGQSGYICVANVHMVTTATRDERLRRIMEEADLVTTDGMPLVWVLRQQGFKDAERVTGTHVTLRLCGLAAQDGMPVYFYGGSPETIYGLKKFIGKRFPFLQAFYDSPPLISQQSMVDPHVVSRIKASGSRIVFVGLGCPKQEFWMAAYKPHLPALLIGVGAVFDFLSGTVKRAPGWVQKAGLEWLFRLSMDPKRLWKRYLLYNTKFLFKTISEIVSQRKPPAFH